MVRTGLIVARDVSCLRSVFSQTALRRPVNIPWREDCRALSASMARKSVSPNFITLANLFVGLTGATLLWAGGYLNQVAGSSRLSVSICLI